MKCLVIMPYGTTEVYENAVKLACEDAGYECIHADDVNAPDNVIKDLIGQINASHLVIADLTDRNPAICYQLGVAHSLGKNVIMICRDVDRDIPPDLRPYSTIAYDPSEDMLGVFRDELENALLSVVTGRQKPANPVIDFLGHRAEAAGSARSPFLDIPIKTYLEQVKTLDPQVVKDTRITLILFELQTQTSPGAFENGFLGRIRELIEGYPEWDRTRKKEFIRNLDELELAVASDDYAIRSKAQESFAQNLLHTLRQPIGKAHADLLAFPPELWPVAYEYYLEICDENYGQWYVCVEINKVLVMQNDKNAIPLLLEIIQRSPTPNNSFSEDCLETGRRILGRREFNSVLDEIYGYDFGAKWEIEKQELSERLERISHPNEDRR